MIRGQTVYCDVMNCLSSAELSAKADVEDSESMEVAAENRGWKVHELEGKKVHYCQTHQNVPPPTTALKGKNASD